MWTSPPIIDGNVCQQFTDGHVFSRALQCFLVLLTAMKQVKYKMSNEKKKQQNFLPWSSFARKVNPIVSHSRLFDLNPPAIATAPCSSSRFYRLLCTGPGSTSAWRRQTTKPRPQTLISGHVSLQREDLLCNDLLINLEVFEAVNFGGFLVHCHTQRDLIALLR